ncbi:MAG: GNAT family N-acetyltransferase [Actinomycetota bacterium]
MKIRSGLPDDLSQLTQVALNAIAGSGYSIEQKEMWSRTFTDEDLGHILHEDVVIVVEIDGVAAGFASLTDQGDTAGNLNLLYVDPKFSRWGVGKRLVRAIEDEALRLGMTALWVDASEPAVHRLLQLGYRPHEKNIKVIESVTFENTWMRKMFL